MGDGKNMGRDSWSHAALDATKRLSHERRPTRRVLPRMAAAQMLHGRDPSMAFERAYLQAVKTDKKQLIERCHFLMGKLQGLGAPERIVTEVELRREAARRAAASLEEGKDAASPTMAALRDLAWDSVNDFIHAPGYLASSDEKEPRDPRAEDRYECADDIGEEQEMRRKWFLP